MNDSGPNFLQAVSAASGRVVFGTSCLGNLYHELPYDAKREIVAEFCRNVTRPVIDTAGKYGAGLALEVIGQSLRELGVPPQAVVISNKLGWKRVALQGPEPTFEPGVWARIGHDAVQCIGYDGILECWHQGCELLGAEYAPSLLSVHDPDEYLAAAASPADRRQRLGDVLEAYRALHELKANGRCRAIGVGAKDWRVVRELSGLVALDWVMLACSLTVHTHPPELLEFIAQLRKQGVAVINSAVFHGGFLTGGTHFDYRRADRGRDAALFAWREEFDAVCRRHGAEPAAVCVQFGLSVPGVVAAAMNSSQPRRVADNVAAANVLLPPGLWSELKQCGLIDATFPYLGEGSVSTTAGAS